MQFQQKITRLDRAFLGIALLFQVSILYSVFLLSISMFLLGIVALWHFRDQPKALLNKLLRDYWRHPVLWVVSLHFFIVLISGYYSDDTEFWLSRLRLKTPFLLLPMAFYILPRLSTRVYHLLFYQLMLVMTASSLPVLWSFISDPKEAFDLIAQGQAVPVPGNHIRYSLLVSIACAAGVHLWYRRFRWAQGWEPKLILGISLYLFGFSHLMAVRSGLVTLYLALFVLLVIQVVSSERRRTSVVLLSGLLVSPLVAFTTLKSLRTKAAYAIEDYQKFSKGEWSAYSDAERLLSIQGGLNLFHQHPWLGVGFGDLRTEMKNYFRETYNMGTFLLPHNQYIFTMAGGGLLALLLFAAALLLPAWHCRGDHLFLVVNIVVLLSMLVENTLETSMGIAIYIFYLGCALHFAHPRGDLPSVAQPNSN